MRELGVRERPAFRAVGQHRSTQWRRSTRSTDEQRLTNATVDLASRYRRHTAIERDANQPPFSVNRGFEDDCVTLIAAIAGPVEPYDKPFSVISTTAAFTTAAWLSGAAF